MSTSIAESIGQEYESRYGTPRVEVIKAGRVRDYLLAMNERPGVSADIPVPALFLMTLARTRRPQPSRGIAVNAGDDYEFLRPVFIGDAIEPLAASSDVQVKAGQGRFDVSVTKAEVTYRNQHGVVVAVAKSNILRWGL